MMGPIEASARIPKPSAAWSAFPTLPPNKQAGVSKPRECVVGRQGGGVGRRWVQVRVPAGAGVRRAWRTPKPSERMMGTVISLVVTPSNWS